MNPRLRPILSLLRSTSARWPQRVRSVPRVVRRPHLFLLPVMLLTTFILLCGGNRAQADTWCSQISGAAFYRLRSTPP